MNTSFKKITIALLAAILVMGGLAFPGSPASAAAVSIDLCASNGSITMPDAVTINVWGFVQTTACGPGLVNGTNFPGPVLSVSEGDTVTINVTNALPAGHTLRFEAPGITFDAGATDAAAGATVSRTFTANAPGTYLYQSAGDAGRQTAMGLYGALVVRPLTSGQAYDTPATAYDTEATLVLSQIDPNFNAAPDTFDMYQYLATYWLINGKPYPNTTPIFAPAGQRVLLRYLNAGYDNTSMMLIGMHERVLARDARLLNNPFDADAETIPAGATEDVVATVPSTAPPSTHGFPLYNRQLHDGMMTFISPTGPVDQPPVVNAGTDQTITLPASANLDGTVTDDGLSPLTTTWSMTSGPGTVTFGNASLVDTTASFSTSGSYVLRLTATDGTGSVFDEVAVTVNPAGPVDQPPVVNAGTDQTITLPASANLDGTVTDDGLSPLTTVWSMTSGPGTVTFGNASLVDTTASFSTSGSYVLRLTATDGTGSVFDEVSVTVNPAGPVDQPPVVNAGTDQTITLPASANLDGTVTDDGLSPLTTIWSMTSGPGTVTFGNASLVDTTASFSTSGSYVLRLTATDGTGSVFDEVSVTVNPAGQLTMHIGAMSGSATSNGGPVLGTYTATITITVHDANHNPLAGVTVTGRWTTGTGTITGATLTCTTNASGQCSVQATHSRFPNNSSNTLTFTVNTLTLAGYTYVPANNDVSNSFTVPRQ